MRQPQQQPTTSFPSERLPNSNTIGKMPGTYTIFRDPNIQPIQYVRSQVPIEYRKQVEKTLQELVNLQVISPLTRPTKWVSSLTFPCKPDGILQIALTLSISIKPPMESSKKPNPGWNFLLIKLIYYFFQTQYKRWFLKHSSWQKHPISPYFSTHKGRYQFFLRLSD